MALVGIAAADCGKLRFDTAVGSRKLRNLRAFPRVAVVISCDDEVTLQCERPADVVVGKDPDRCLRAYVQQFPDGRQRAKDPQIVLVRIGPDWGRLSDYRRYTFRAADLDLRH